MTKKREGNKSVVPREYWTPISLFDDMERAFDDFRLGMRDFWLPSITTIGPRVPAVDMREEENEYVIEAELPGIRKEDVQIEVTEGGLKISATKETMAEEKKEGYLRKERGYLSFRRQLSIPEDSDVDGIEAKLMDGVLRINIPKKEKPEEKKKTVEVK